MADTEVSFEPLGEEELTTFFDGVRGGYVEELVATGVSFDDASTQADAVQARIAPDGRPAPGQLVGHVIVSSRPIGVLWVGPAGNDPARWWVFDIVIDEEWRGKGYGRQAMLLAEQIAREHGATSIGLNVFARNTVAVSLYNSLGYTEGSLQMSKSL